MPLALDSINLPNRERRTVRRDDHQPSSEGLLPQVAATTIDNAEEKNQG